MKLREALEAHKYIQRRVETGTHIISEANFGGGYYKDFLPDGGKSSPVSTSQHWYTSELLRILGEQEGWEPQS